MTPPRVISQDLYASVVTVANANAAAYARVASGHQDVAGQWMGRAANLPETNAGAAVDAAAGQAQRQAVAHQNESDALDATANYHRRAADLGQQMNAQLDRLDQRAQRLIEGSPAAWHPRIRALAQAAGEALNDLYSMQLWDLQERAGSVIEPIHQGINGLGGTGGAAPSKASPKLGEASGPRSAAASSPPTGPNLGPVSPGTASAAAPAAASQPDRPELVPVAVGVGVPVPVENGGGESANRRIPPICPPGDDDDDDDGGGGTIVSIPAGSGAGGRAGSEKLGDSPGLGKPSDSDDLAKTAAPAAPSVASPVESATPLAAAPAAADRRQRRRPQTPNGKGQTP